MPDIIVDPLAVPNVVNLLKQDAQDNIEGAYLNFAFVNVPGTPVGYVRNQSPTAGTEVEAFTLVTVYVFATSGSIRPLRRTNMLLRMAFTPIELTHGDL